MHYQHEQQRSTSKWKQMEKRMETDSKELHGNVVNLLTDKFPVRQANGPKSFKDVMNLKDKTFNLSAEFLAQPSASKRHDLRPKFLGLGVGYADKILNTESHLSSEQQLSVLHGM